MSRREPPAGAPDVSALESRTAGGRVIRGGALLTAGYLAGTVLAAVASVFLLRYLGVEDFGRYIVVMSIVAIVSGVTDVGLTIVGQREYATVTQPGARRRLIANIAGIRLALTPLGVLAGAIFAVVAGYESNLVAGVLLAGAGLVLVNTAATYTVPLTVDLRFGATTAVQVSKQVALVVGFGALVAAAGSLTTFFAVHIAAGLVMLVAAVALTGRGQAPGPSFALREWLPLLRQTAPVAVALIVNVVYVRMLVIMTSLLVDAAETGLFATSYRVVEVFVGVPAFMVGAAFPLMAHAAASDRDRLAYVLQRLAEVGLLVSLGLVLLLAFAAEPVIEVLGGSEYSGASTVLAIQAFALIGAFMTQVWVQALVSIHRQRALVLGNAVALVTVVVLGLLLIPPYEAHGAAVAAVVGEVVLAGAYLIMLARADAALRPQLGFVPKLAAAAGVGAGLALALGPPPLLAAALAGAAYLAVAFALRAIPVEVFQAFAARRAAPLGEPDPQKRSRR